jgi:hypothetical protein
MSDRHANELEKMHTPNLLDDRAEAGSGGGDGRRTGKVESEPSKLDTATEIYDGPPLS